MSTSKQSSILPRRGSVLYGILNEDEKSVSKSITRFSWWNRLLMVPLYRLIILPLFGIGRLFLLLYHRGRKSGKQFITPLQYRKYQGRTIVFSIRGTKADWYQNLMANPGPAQIKIGFHKHDFHINEINDSEKLEVMKWYVTSFPFAASKLIGWDKDKDTYDSLHRIVSTFAIIEFDLK